MILDEESRLAPAPCRVLFRATVDERGKVTAGQWAPDAPEDVRQRQLRDIPMEPEKPPRTPWIAPMVGRDPLSMARERKPKQARAVRPKAPPKPKREKRQSHSAEPQPGLIPGAGGGWNRRPEINLARILELRKQGKTLAQISAELSCHPSAVSKWLAKQAKVSDAVAADLAAKRKCACGRKKLVVDDSCWRCRTYQREKDKRADSRKVWKAASADLTAKMVALSGEGRTAGEIAKLLDTTIGAVYTRLHRAKQEATHGQ